jgi:hypothetical protein
MREVTWGDVSETRHYALIKNAKYLLTIDF